MLGDELRLLGLRPSNGAAAGMNNLGAQLVQVSNMLCGIGSGSGIVG
jgi:hypothetical protein